MKSYSWRKTKEPQSNLEEQKRNVFRRAASHVYRNWGLARRLEHVRNRSNRRKQHKD